jgi:hypothetical protein
MPKKPVSSPTTVAAPITREARLRSSRCMLALTTPDRVGTSRATEEMSSPRKHCKSTAAVTTIKAAKATRSRSGSTFVDRRVPT